MVKAKTFEVQMQQGTLSTTMLINTEIFSIQIVENVFFDIKHSCR